MFGSRKADNDDKLSNNHIQLTHILCEQKSILVSNLILEVKLFDYWSQL